MLEGPVFFVSFRGIFLNVSIFWLKTQNCVSVSTAKHFSPPSSSSSAATTIGEWQRAPRRGGGFGRGGGVKNVQENKVPRKEARWRRAGSPGVPTVH